MSVEFSKEARKKFDKIVSQYPEKQAAMLPVLYLAEKEFGHISQEVEEYVSELLEVPSVKVHEVMTFYTLFARKPRGKLHFQVCRGPSCDLLGCKEIIDYLAQRINLQPGETDDDLNYTLEEVECLAACEVAPMMQLNEEYIGHLSKEKIDEILKNRNGKK